MSPTGKLDPGATIRKFRIVQSEETRSISRLIDHDALSAILERAGLERRERATL
jgi:hypothetical protein